MKLELYLFLLLQSNFEETASSDVTHSAVCFQLYRYFEWQRKQEKEINTTTYQSSHASL